MRTVAISGSKRGSVGKRTAKELRYQGEVPAILYGGKEQTSFSVKASDLRDLIYTPEVAFVELTVDGTTTRAIVQEKQFHPLTDLLLHIDFLQLFEDKPVTMSIPVKLTGTSPGVRAGGKLLQKLRTLKLKALPKNMPQFVEVSIEKLEVGKSVSVSDLAENNYTILSTKEDTIVSVAMSRAMKQAEGQ